MTLRICFLSEILFLFTAEDNITLYHQLSRYCIILKHLSSVFEVHSKVGGTCIPFEAEVFKGKHIYFYVKQNLMFVFSKHSL